MKQRLLLAGNTVDTRVERAVALDEEFQIYVVQLVPSWRAREVTRKLRCHLPQLRTNFFGLVPQLLPVRGSFCPVHLSLHLVMNLQQLKISIGEL